MSVLFLSLVQETLQKKVHREWALSARSSADLRPGEKKSGGISLQHERGIIDQYARGVRKGSAEGAPKSGVARPSEFGGAQDKGAEEASLYT